MPSFKSSLIKPAASITERRRKSYSSSSYLRYPKDLGAHAVVMNFRTYQYKGDNQATSVDAASIVLPLPKNIQDSYTVEVGGSELGISGAAVAGAAADLKAKGLGVTDAIADTAKNLMADAAGMAGMNFENMLGEAASGAAGAMRVLARAGLTTLTPSLGTGLDAGLGNTVNPHMTVAFNGVGLKSHQFDWDFSPKSREEAELLAEIADNIKASILPTYGNAFGQVASSVDFMNRSLLNYPMTVDIFFLGLDQRYMFHFKRCMVQNFNVNYTPNGMAISRGGIPSFVNMSMQLIETEIHTAEDYGRGLGNTTYSQ